MHFTDWIDFASSQYNSMLQTLEELVQIPAHSGKEKERALYCVKWLRQNGITAIDMDEANNVIVAYPSFSERYNCIFMSHLDTVFDDTISLCLKKESNIWSCPGIGDNTANVVIQLYLLKYLYGHRISLHGAYLFAFDTGEEGLGNLAGCKALMQRYRSSINSVVCFDLYQKDLFTDCIGSVRFRVTVKTEGGHSYMDFGNRNAIHGMAELIHELYQFQPDLHFPVTYNVGRIEGGTSVNTIAQSGSFLFEYRSKYKDALKTSEQWFYETLEKMKRRGYQIAWDNLGERPCSNLKDTNMINKLADCWEHSIERFADVTPIRSTASTDCNIPLSLGIPAICAGTIIGGGAHTTEEWIDITSLNSGISAVIGMIFDIDLLFYEVKD